jgi:aminopeptidase
MQSIYEKYADLLVHYSLDIRKGDKLLISSTPLAEPLIQEVYRAALLAGAHPETWISLAGMARVLYDEGNKEQLSYVSPMYFHAVEHYDAFLTIRAPYNVKELQGVDPERKKISSMAEAPMRKIYRDRAASGGLRWTLCEFPTDSQAQECGFSRREYEAFVFSACLLGDDDPAASWRMVRTLQQRVVDLLNTASRVRYSGPDIDISFSTEGRRWVNSDGRHNMPSGEVYTSPVEDSVEGHIPFSYPRIYIGQEIEAVRLVDHKGKIVEWQAAKGRELLDRILEVPGADHFGEAAIGTNNGIRSFTRNMLFDEKIGGTVHMALGSSYVEAGGENESAVHWDLLADMRNGGEIYADSRLVYRNGDFVF